MEGDGPLSCAAVVNDRISIHALREEGDRFALPFRFPPIKFLSTPSARRATKRLEGLTPIQKISIHALPRGGRLLIITPQGCKGRISIHAPPRRGRRACVGHQQPSAISTHALREEGDQSVGHKSAVAQQISIHALREEGDGPPVKPRNLLTSFLSTPSARRATHPDTSGADRVDISIHALREEGDFGNGAKMLRLKTYFYPRPP